MRANVSCSSIGPGPSGAGRAGGAGLRPVGRVGQLHGAGGGGRRLEDDALEVGRRVGVVKADDVHRHRSEIAGTAELEERGAGAGTVDGRRTADTQKLVTMGRAEVDAEPRSSR